MNPRSSQYALPGFTNSRIHGFTNDLPAMARADRQPEPLDEELPEAHLNRRTKICIWIIVLGLVNFMAYSWLYFSLRGEAVHGSVTAQPVDGGHVHRYYLLDRGQMVEVSHGTWLFSGLHSISMPLTVGAILLAMLTLAKDRIASSMARSIIRGRLLITLLALAVTVCSLGWTLWFAYLLSSNLHNASGGP